jgi:hypothetical protein
VDGLTPTTADALHGENRGYSEVEGGMVARGIPRKPGRVYLMAPARWKSANPSGRRRSIAPPVLMPAPAQWIHSRRVPSGLPARAPRPATEHWLLPSTWPLDGWCVSAVAGLRRFVDARIASWARTRMSSWPVWAGASRQRLAAGVGIGAIASAALVLLRLGVPHPGTGPTPARVVAAAPASVTQAPSLPATPAPLAIAAAAPASASTVPAARAGQAESGRKLLSDVSTMDLMMPIEEPDLDITSRQSLWSQIGKA